MFVISNGGLQLAERILKPSASFAIIAMRFSDVGAISDTRSTPY